MGSHIAAVEQVTTILREWQRALVVQSGFDEVPMLDEVLNEGLDTTAKDLVTEVVIDIVTRVIQGYARTSQAARVATRLQQADIIDGYPRAFYHLCCDTL